MFTQGATSGSDTYVFNDGAQTAAIVMQCFNYKVNQFHSLPLITSARNLITIMPLSDHTWKQSIQHDVSPAHVKTEKLFHIPCLPRHENSSVVANKPYVLSSALCQQKFVIIRMTLNKRAPRIFHWGKGGLRPRLYIKNHDINVTATSQCFQLHLYTCKYKEIFHDSLV